VTSSGPNTENSIVSELYVGSKGPHDKPGAHADGQRPRRGLSGTDREWTGSGPPRRTLQGDNLVVSIHGHTPAEHVRMAV
jgi:hypothetical protein